MGRNAGSTLIVALFSPFLDLSRTHRNFHYEFPSVPATSLPSQGQAESSSCGSMSRSTYRVGPPRVSSRFLLSLPRSLRCPESSARSFPPQLRQNHLPSNIRRIKIGFDGINRLCCDVLRNEGNERFLLKNDFPRAPPFLEINEAVLFDYE